ncbi:LOW QUALITY PROTEIN: hypothetical protein PHMEG_00018217 [Phytophthora megakarya]|uniref:Uncharacterized protein n=1 Tax=Phytophthora megakarya TaxID=4795 RepID=A0A225VVV5_9STRA|nr:LOW QUALITY PROTEIN: hypothetical protein PHMEG_00018217 [Phytophthora megakarya]
MLLKNTSTYGMGNWTEETFPVPLGTCPFTRTLCTCLHFSTDCYVVINLSCGFRRSGSLAFYSLAGSVINDLYELAGPVSVSPVDMHRFHGSVWCDDILARNENRRDNSNFALRKVMLIVLGRTAIITKKFTPWSSTNKELGLLWNTVDGTVSIPLDMMDRSLAQVDSVVSARKTSKADLAKQLGVFPHVATCFPSAGAFYQRAHTAMININPFTRHPITDVVVEDWRWFKAVLLHNERFNQVPVSQFADLASS